MKKKSVRKVSSAKKVISKSPLKKKKSFSLKSWLLGGLVLFVASAYGLYQYNLQPQGIKVLQIPGTVLDYLEPEAVSINAIRNCGQDPECADLVDAARRAGAPVTLQQQSQTSARVAEEVKSNIKNVVDKEEDPNDDERARAAQDARNAAESIKAREAAAATAAVAERAARVQNNANTGVVGQTGAGCSTSAGFTVASGETMVGKVAADGINNQIVKCENGTWTTQTGCLEKNGVVTGGASCTLTVKPIYAGGKNCYNDGGATVLGDGSIIDNGDNTASRCDGGKMVKDLIKYEGKWVTPEEKVAAEAKKKAKEDAEQAQLAYNEKNCLGTWDKEAKVCRQSAASSNPKTTPYSMEGCENAIVDKNKEECKRSTDNPNLWLIVPKGGAAIKSGVPAKTSSEINKPTSPSTTFSSGPDCDRAKTEGYTCESIAGGNYYKLTPVSELPAPQREYVADAQGNFGSTSQGNSSSQQETIKEYSGQYAYRDCMAAANSMGNDVGCNVSGTDGTYESYDLVREIQAQPQDQESNSRPGFYDNYLKAINKPPTALCYFSFQCSDGLSCNGNRCGGESGTTKVANSSSQTTTTQEETIKEYSGQYAYRDCMAAANSMGNDVGCNVSGTDGTYESYNLVKQVIVPANQTNTSANNNLKKPGESCNALGFLWFGSDDQCNSGICGRRESGDISGKAGNYCANESGNIPSAKVDYPEKSLSECKETLPSDQECVRNPETGYFYRSYK